MKSYFLLAFFIFASLFSSDYLQISDQILEDYRLDMLLDHGLTLSGSGGGYMNNLNKIIQEFNAQGNRNIDDSRSLFVQANMKLLKKLNQDRNLRPFLSHYPFTFEDIQIKISFYSNNEKVSYPYVSYISVIDNKICYNTIDCKDNKRKYQLLHSETYEEACALLDQMDPNQFK